MNEVENNVQVRVKGPKEEIETYIGWLKCTEEYRLKSGFNKKIPASRFSLTDFSPLEDTWKFTSTNMRHQIKNFYRWNLDVLTYQVNYIVYYGTSTLANDSTFTIKVENYEEGIFPELVHSFNPIPSMIRLKCPHLNIELKWKSYYLKSKYQVHAFESDSAIY